MRSKFSTPASFRKSSAKKSPSAQVILPLSCTPSCSLYAPESLTASAFSLASFKAVSARSKPTTSYPQEASRSTSWPLPQPGTRAVFRLLPEAAVGAAGPRREVRSARRSCSGMLGPARSQGVTLWVQRRSHIGPWDSAGTSRNVEAMTSAGFMVGVTVGDVGGFWGDCGGSAVAGAMVQ